MDSIGFVSNIYTGLISVLLLLVLTLLAWRVRPLFGNNTRRMFLWQSDAGLFLKTASALTAVVMILILFTIPVFLYVASSFKLYIPGWLTHATTVTVMLFAGLEIWLAVRVTESMPQKAAGPIVTSILVLVMLGLTVLLASVIPGLFAFPDEEESYILELPVHGTWAAGHAGQSLLLNPHNHLDSQRYAIDIVKVDERGRFYERPGNEMEQVFSSGEPVISPADGVVITTEQKLPDHGISLQPDDLENPLGNHVVIRFKEERYIFLAHLQEGSLQVTAGDSVSAGDPIGAVGNSGYTRWPHLHMHIQNRPSQNNYGSTAYPFRFKEMKRKRWFRWNRVENGFLVRNDLFQN